MAAAMDVDEEVPTTSADKGSKKRFEVKKVSSKSCVKRQVLIPLKVYFVQPTYLSSCNGVTMLKNEEVAT